MHKCRYNLMSTVYCALCFFSGTLNPVTLEEWDFRTLGIWDLGTFLRFIKCERNLRIWIVWKIVNSFSSFHLFIFCSNTAEFLNRSADFSDKG